MSLQFTINFDPKLAAVLTTVIIGKKLLTLSDSIHVVSPEWFHK